MAFSTFRGMMAASSATTPPPTDTDLFGGENFTAFYAASGYSGGSASIVPGTGSTYYGVTTLSDASTPGTYAFVMTRSGSYTYISNSLLISANVNNSFVDASSIDSTHFLATLSNASSTIPGFYMTNTGGTLSTTVGPTTVVTGGGALNVGSCVVLDSSNALVFGGSNTASRNRISLINPTTLTAIQANTSATSIAFSNVQVGLFKVSSTLALISWLNASNHTMISTIDVVSGASFTLNAAFDAGALGGQSFAQFYPINSTTVLMVYYKSANTLAARTVTLGVGGSVTLNTEYTTTAAGIYIGFAPFKIAQYGSSYAIGYGGNAGSPSFNQLQSYMSSLVISGNVITWDTSGFSAINTGYNYSVNYNLSTGTIIPIDSTHVAVALPLAASGNRTIFTGYVDVNPTTQTWGTFNGLNSGAMTDATNFAVYATNPTFLQINGPLLLGAGYASGGTLQFYQFTTLGGQNAKIIPNSARDTGITGAVATMCNLGYDSTNFLSRVLAAYPSASNTVTTQVISFGGGGSAGTLGATTTFTAASLNTTQTGVCNLINLSADSSLFLGYNGSVSPTKYYGAVITTSAETAPTVGTYSSAITVASQNVQQWNNGAGGGFLQYSVIDSTHVAVSFLSTNTGSGLYSMYVCILSISGTTITSGTPVAVFSGYSNAPQIYGVVNFGNGTGIVTYNNDAGPSTQLLAKGFTYSGTTITLGSANTLVTGLSMPNGQNFGNGNSMMVKLSTTEAMVLTVEGFSSTATNNLRKLTYVNVNSVTVGSAVAAGTSASNSSASAGLISTDTYNNGFYSYGLSSSPAVTMYQWYRG